MLYGWIELKDCKHIWKEISKEKWLKLVKKEIKK